MGDDEEKNAKILASLKEYIKKFKGTHNYHNFTQKGNPKEKTNMRYILDMQVDRVPKEELEKILGAPSKNQYVKFKLHGQSFIYHQIRKMIGSLVQIFQEQHDEDFLVNAFTHNKTPVWLAPSQGLLLDRVIHFNQIHFTAYNKKEDNPESLECTPEEVTAIEDFKREVVYPVVLKAEEDMKIFTQWMTVGREYNVLASKDPNFLSHWCNEDMVYAPDGNIVGKDLKFEKEEKPEND